MNNELKAPIFQKNLLQSPNNIAEMKRTIIIL